MLSARHAFSRSSLPLHRGVTFAKPSSFPLVSRPGASGAFPSSSLSSGCGRVRFATSSSFGRGPSNGRTRFSPSFARTWVSTRGPKACAPLLLPRRTIRTHQHAREVELLEPQAQASGWGAAAALSTVGIGGICYYGFTSKASLEGWPTHVKQRIRATYGYVAGGLVTTAGAATLMFRSGIAYRALAVNPILFALGGAAATIGSMVAIHSIDPANSLARHAAFGLFNASIALSLAPLGFLGGPLVMRAMTVTAGIVGGLTFVAASSPNESFLWLGGPLSIGLGGLIGASLCQMFFPGSLLLHNVVMYGGLGLFGAFMLYDTQKIITKAQLAPAGEYDPMTSSIGVYLNVIQIFWRIAMMMAGSSNNKRR